jgi:hypothetical protein
MKMTRENNQTKGQTMNDPNDFFIGDHVLITYPINKLAVSGIIGGIRIGENSRTSVELRFDGHYTYFDIEKAEVERA